MIEEGEILDDTEELQNGISDVIKNEADAIQDKSEATNQNYQPVTTTKIPELFNGEKNDTDSRINQENGHRKHVTCNFEGMSLIDSFEMLEKVGEGTFGVVHRARDRKTKEEVALKKIIVHNEKDGFPITALREIRILKSLDHKNVVPLLSMCTEKTSRYHRQFYMVFPYMEHDLAGLLDCPNIHFSTPQIKCYLRQLLEGMFYLHSSNYIHRDIKGANILINNRGELKIADFGLARALDEKKKHYTPTVVTRWYRPPELLLGCPKYTTAVDIWGIGCILGEMYTKKPILQGKSDINQLELIAELCGTPNPDNMPHIKTYRDYDKIKLPIATRKIRTVFSRYSDEQMVDLLDKLLSLDPEARPSALIALDHDFFWTEPLPAEPKDLPMYPSVHEYDRRKAASESSSLSSRHASQSQNPPPPKHRPSEHPNPPPKRQHTSNNHHGQRAPYDEKRRSSSSNHYQSSHSNHNSYRPSDSGRGRDSHYRDHRERDNNHHSRSNYKRD